MEKNKKVNKKKSIFNIEILIIFVIAALMIFLINFANAKLNEVITVDREALLMNSDANSLISDDLAKEIIKFRPESCKMIELFSQNFELIFRVQFRENDESRSYDSIKNHPELMDLFLNNKNGHANITVDGEEEDIYFEWTTTNTGDAALMIIYMARPVVKNLWLFSFVCYMILFLVFLLIIIMKYRMHKQLIREYENLQNSIKIRIERY